MNYTRRFTYIYILTYIYSNSFVCLFTRFIWNRMNERMKETNEISEKETRKQHTKVDFFLFTFKYVEYKHFGVCFHIFGFGWCCCCCFFLSILLNKILNFCLKAGSIGLLLRAVRRVKKYCVYFECSFCFYLFTISFIVFGVWMPVCNWILFL